MRIGQGYDVHQLQKGRKLVLGGVTIPFEMGLVGHSDADVLSHAIGDALLGAAGLGDIGTHFPDSDERFAGISSLFLLKEIGMILERGGFKISNIDSTIVAERPRMSPHVPAMRRNIAASLAIPEDRVGVKATTSEKLGFVGEERGIAAFASALIYSDTDALA